MSQAYCRAAPYQDSLTHQVKRYAIPPGVEPKPVDCVDLRRLGWRHSPNGIGRRDPAVVASWSRRTRGAADLSPCSIAWYCQQPASASPERKESSSYSLVIASRAGTPLSSRSQTPERRQLRIIASAIRTCTTPIRPCRMTDGEGEALADVQRGSSGRKQRGSVRGHFGDGRAVAGRPSVFGREVAEMNCDKVPPQCGQRPTALASVACHCERVSLRGNA